MGRENREAMALKARVVRRPPAVLAYGCTDVEKLSEVCRALGAGLRVLQPEDWATRLGVLAGEAGPESPAAGEAPQESLLVFAYFSDALLDRALAALRKAGLAFDYKAMLTPTNRAWPLYALLEELKRERAQIDAQRSTP